MRNKYVFVVLSLLMALSSSAQTVNPEGEKNEKYPFRKGNLLLSKENVKLNYVKHNEIRKDTILMKNVWERPMLIGHKPLPAHLGWKALPDTLQPGQEGMVVLSYDAKKKNDFGYSYENMTLTTNDPGMPDKSFFVMVYIEEDFSGLSAEDRANAPRIRFASEEYKYGTIKSGEKIRFAFEFRNEGKSDLIIRSTKATCGCTVTSPEKTTLKPGEGSKINVVFDSFGLTGEQRKTIYVYCNDPRYATVALHLVGTIE